MANEMGVGRKMTKGLFIQNAEEYPHVTQIYDLDEFHEVFIARADLTEYIPAIDLVGDWAEWNRIKRDWPYFAQLVEDWKEELEVKFKSEAIQKVLSLVDDSVSDSVKLQAAKFLSKKEWELGNKRGRPSNAEVNHEAKRIAEKAATTSDEERRIYEVVNGGKEN